MATKKETKRAAALADLEYNPQFRQIRDLWDQATGQYHRDLGAARNLSTSVQQQAKASQPTVSKIFDDAAKGMKASNSFVDQALAAKTPGTPASDSPLSSLLSQAMQRERGSAANANTAAKTQGLNALVQRASGAEAGKALAYTAAKQNLLANRKTLTQRLGDLTGDKQAKITALALGYEDDRSKANAETKKTASKTISSGVYAGLTQGELDGMSTQERLDWKAKHNKSTGDKDHEQHIKDVHLATSKFRTRIEDAIGAWDQFAKQTARRTEIKEGTDGKQTETVVLDPKTKQPILDKPTPDDIRGMMVDAGYTPGEIHIALLRRAPGGGKPLDAQALRYLKGLAGQGIRVPRDWLPKTTYDITQGTGNPASSRGTGLG